MARCGNVKQKGIRYRNIRQGNVIRSSSQPSVFGVSSSSSFLSLSICLPVCLSVPLSVSVSSPLHFLKHMACVSSWLAQSQPHSSNYITKSGYPTNMYQSTFLLHHHILFLLFFLAISSKPIPSAPLLLLPPFSLLPPPPPTIPSPLHPPILFLIIRAHSFPRQNLANSAAKFGKFRGSPRHGR